MASHLLEEMKRIAPDLYDQLVYVMIESSNFHRGLQMEELVQHRDKVLFLEEWEESPSVDYMFVIANELLDAFPVHRLQYLDGHFLQSFIRWCEDKQSFEEIWLPVQDKRILDLLDEQKVQLTQGQIMELNLDASSWLTALYDRMGNGECIVIDYGDLQDELLASHRHQGTLLCYRKHQASGDFLHGLGQQDITSHVNFSQCIQAAEKAGFQDIRLQTQREFLVQQGILQKLQEHNDPNPFSDISRRNRTIRQLLLSDQMSELFKVWTAHKKNGPNE
ncbi:SAM-dependent methyltransferase [Paenibacillus hexagrammi]|uniref:SAM-dependent methyltransferase n=1 Tax=Paenibacillus hexagrammi TaxID=2908839 RepID=A0ABY3SMJ8_9BACL|nr:SAM-dependent methyltransferase [Paenibacillus sp. YPD9-1]UJF35118.1 SAM-dependent methyltransferase [Paenibacillus sp. YPD9-1]